LVNSHLGDLILDLCFGFEVHQPYRIRKDFHSEISKGKKIEKLFEIYFDNEWNKDILKRVATKCYRPSNEIMLENIDKFRGEKKQFKIAYSISGVLVEQLERWAPDVINSFKNLAKSGCVEFLDQTYYHSLSSLFSTDREEFIEQILLHNDLMKDVFRYAPMIFENTEFIYNDSIANVLEKLGYRAVFTEGVERILTWRSPNYIYKSASASIPILLRNNQLSDDIAFRFSARDWVGWPLTADKYAAWLSTMPGQCINVFIDYETFGEHQWQETGILEFLKWLPREILRYDDLHFKTPSELISSHIPVGEIKVHDFDTVSWADVERSTKAWFGNDMQRTAYNALKNLEPYVKKTKDENIFKLWRTLQVSDLLYYMFTELGSSGLVHGYFSSQPPVQAFWAFTRVLSDFYEKVAANLKEPYRTTAYLNRIVAPDKAFHFHQNGKYIKLSAHSIEEFRDTLSIVSEGSLLYHLKRRDFENWINQTIGDAELADCVRRVGRIDKYVLRKEIIDCINERILKLKIRNR
jgi:alpha-amylase